MKFRDGYWALKPGIYQRNPVEIVDTEKDESKLIIYSTTRKIEHRGHTLNSPIVTTEISSPLEDIIRIRTWHYKGKRESGPDFEVISSEKTAPRIVSNKDFVSFTSGNLEARIDRRDPEQEALVRSAWQITFSYKGRLLTRSAGRHSGHMTVGAPYNGNYGAEGGETFMCEYLGLSVGENIYGMGERFTPFVKNGQSVDIWNEDGGTSSEQAYKNIPFYLSSRGYGVFVNNPGRVQFETASEVVTSVQFSVPGEVLDYYIVSGDSLKNVLENYTAITGKPALPPSWSFGLWLTTSFTTSYDEKTVNSFIDGMAERKIPLHVFHFDCFWMKEYRWVDFEWDRDQFPDPDGMLSRLKKRGLNICLWINPYIGQKSPLFDEGMKGGYLLKTGEGDVWQWDKWQAGMGLVDFTNPEAVQWYREKLRKLIKQGVDTFKTDFGERIPTEVVYHDGSDPLKMHNYYTYLYNKTVFELLEEELGRGKALVFARSATAGSQKFPVHWGGDCAATYESMAESLRGGLSLSMSGFGFWSHDIGGFEFTATPDLYKRWVAFGSFSSHSRLHGNESYRVPWNFDDESCDVLRFFTRLKCSLMPYIFSQAVNTHHTGIPMMRAMVLEYPDDPTCLNLDRQYFFGDSLLVSPVFGEEGDVQYYLPPGKWTDFLSGEERDGGRWYRENHDYMSLPLMVGSNRIIPVGTDSEKPVYDYGKDITFHLFNLEKGEQAVSELHSPEGELIITVKAAWKGDGIIVEKVNHNGYVSGKWNLLLRGIPSVLSVNSGETSKTEKGLLISLGEDCIEVTVTPAD